MPRPATPSPSLPRSRGRGGGRRLGHPGGGSALPSPPCEGELERGPFLSFSALRRARPATPSPTLPRSRRRGGGWRLGQSPMKAGARPLPPCEGDLERGPSFPPDALRRSRPAIPSPSLPRSRGRGGGWRLGQSPMKAEACPLPPCGGELERGAFLLSQNSSSHGRQPPSRPSPAPAGEGAAGGSAIPDEGRALPSPPLWGRVGEGGLSYPSQRSDDHGRHPPPRPSPASRERGRLAAWPVPMKAEACPLPLARESWRGGPSCPPQNSETGDALCASLAKITIEPED